MDQTLTIQNIASKLVPWLNGKLAGEAVVGTAEMNAQSVIFKNLNGEVILQVAIPEIHHVTTFLADNGGITIGITLKDGRDFMLEGIEKDTGLPESTQILAVSKEFGIFTDDYAVKTGFSALDFSNIPKYVYVLIVISIVSIALFMILTKEQ